MGRPDRLRFRSAAAILACLLTALPSPASGPAAPEGTEAPRRIGVAEHVQVPLVLIDVVVRDSKDRPVPGLTLADFELLVDRLPVDPNDIETFEENCSPMEIAPPPAVATAAQALTPEAPAPATAASVGGRHFVLFFDFSHLSLNGRYQSLHAARRYLAGTNVSDEQFMILAYKNSLRLVQDFTSSREILMGRLDGLAGEVASLETEVLEEFSKQRELSQPQRDPASAGTCIGRLQLASSFATEEEARARRAIRTMEDLMPGLAALPGRKALVLFSDALRDEPGIQFLSMAGSTPDSVGIDVQNDLLLLTREANAAGVALYTVYASGLEDVSQAAMARGPDPTEGFESSFRLDLTGASRAGLDAALSLQATLSTETGGRAIQRTNDVAKVLAVARQDMSCHYLLGYRSPGAGNNQRHSLIVRLRPDAEGHARRYDVRHRPYFIDYAPGERRDRVMRSALDLPSLHKTIPVTLEAFALAPSRFGRQLLIKAIVPLSALSLLPAGEDRLEGSVRVKGEITRNGDVSCKVDVEVPVAVPRGGTQGNLIYETGCVLVPGTHDLAVAVMDLSSQEVGASLERMSVPPLPGRNETFVSDIHLWAQDPEAVLVSSQVREIGMNERLAGEKTVGWLPLGRRLLSPGQAAMISVLLCPARPDDVSAETPVRVRRTLKGDGKQVVADFRDLIMTEPPDPASGCYQLLHRVPKDTLGSGVYTFTLQASGQPLGVPVMREADIAVE